MVPVSAFTAPTTRRGGARCGGARAQVAPVSDLEQARRRRPTAINAARAIKEQRRGYARAVLQGVARTHRGLPAAQVRKILTQTLGPLGVRLSPAALRELAGHIEAGRPVELP
jgi:hypothetical protein